MPRKLATQADSRRQKPAKEQGRQAEVRYEAFRFAQCVAGDGRYQNHLTNRSRPMPGEPTIEEVREPFISGDIETCRRLLDWWTDLAKIGGKHEISASEIKRAAQFCQFYLDAMAKSQMSAGEFAGMVVRELLLVASDHKHARNISGVAHNEYAAERVEAIATQHSIEIVEPKR
ncbi:MAG: hypothetical protein KGL39_57475 [Patescibacteria group bacterium]|nr:hypothetical protein [Patescibacteria group bacterium]